MEEQKIYLFVLWFLNTDGSGRELTGGMERYCRDLARLIKASGHKVHIVQKSKVPFEIDYEPGIQVTGVPAELTVKGHISYYRHVCRIVAKDAPVIYVSQDLCMGKNFTKAVGVNHGIWWHGDFSLKKKLLVRWHQRRMLDWLKAIICVDTNYINWLHTEFSGRKEWRHKLSYICNYADTEIFHAPEKLEKLRESVIIVFPRRMMGATLEDEPRGGLLLLEAIKAFKVRNPKVAFNVRMVGRGTLADQLRTWCRENGLENNVDFFEAGFDEMPEVYRNADIVVIPSTGTEGTSLSAIEGMCSGATTVVSHIGGLANIVIDGFNGYVADLSASSLCEAIERAVRQPISFRRPIAALGKQRWDNQVRRFLQTHIGINV
ncbi:glycosyltransferase family 4 protein [uncultured Comamonas sp.]|uniref:glycosyltransferase family 4 protein n=1 Tax=uncultured Comamonas sp. TaxID=114710 RepID=UPI0025CF97D8|nr:glycosyltransferase family 4 protein [uncultured Comamonas sp.]